MLKSNVIDVKKKKKKKKMFPLGMKSCYSEFALTSHVKSNETA